MAKAHVAMSRAGSRSDLGYSLPIVSGTPVASTVAALITLSTSWQALQAGVNQIGRVTVVGSELVPLPDEVGEVTWTVTASGGPILVTVATAGVTPVDGTHPTYLIMTGAFQDIGCVVRDSVLWARDVVL